MEFEMHNLRKAEETDIDFMMELKRATLKVYIDQIWGWEEEYQRNDTLECFYLGNTKIISVNGITIGIVETNTVDNIFHIVELEILPEYQGKGIGSAIICEIIKNEKSKSREIEVGCFKINSSAINLYKRMGFRIYNETDTHYLMKY